MHRASPNLAAANITFGPNVDQQVWLFVTPVAAAVGPLNAPVEFDATNFAPITDFPAIFVYGTFALTASPARLPPRVGCRYRSDVPMSTHAPSQAPLHTSLPRLGVPKNSVLFI